MFIFCLSSLSVLKETSLVEISAKSAATSYVNSSSPNDQI